MKVLNKVWIAGCMVVACYYLFVGSGKGDNTHEPRFMAEAHPAEYSEWSADSDAPEAEALHNAESALTQDAFTLFTHPADGSIYLQFEKDLQVWVDVEVFDPAGKLIHHSHLYGLRFYQSQLELGDLDPGMYLVRMRAGKSSVSRSLHVQG